jgi:2-amino-4-hydroxy-6-hydroxymethyldihydropteridine diphosphokinase
MPRVFISIGSNIDRVAHIRGAVQALNALYGPLTLSRVYETETVGFKGDRFYNLVAAFDTEAPIEDIHRELARLEVEHGRTREGLPKFSPRTLDLDILLYGNLVRHDASFDIPRDEITRYAFVLGPLAEVAPDLRHLETGATYREMWQQFPQRGQELHPVPLALDLKSR